MAVKDAVLQALEQARGERLSGGRLAAQLGVSRAAVHKAIGALRSGGLAIDGVPGEGYRLASEDDSLTAAGVAALLDTDCIGRDLLVVPSLTSTNTVLKERYLGRPHGFVLLAEEQTGGRGRLGRSFASPAGTGIYLTILLHPTLPIQHIQFITIAAAVAVAEAIGRTAGFDPQIKWVNDVLMDGRKLCGILTEAMIEGETGTVSSLIAGIGVNLRPNPDWPDEVPSCRALSVPIPCSSRDGRPSCLRATAAACAASAGRSRSSALPQNTRRCAPVWTKTGTCLSAARTGRSTRCPRARSASGSDRLSTRSQREKS